MLGFHIDSSMALVSDPSWHDLLVLVQKVDPSPINQCNTYIMYLPEALLVLYSSSHIHL